MLVLVLVSLGYLDGMKLDLSMVFQSFTANQYLCASVDGGGGNNSSSILPGSPGSTYGGVEGARRESMAVRHPAEMEPREL